jgi:hypothetical protein
MPTEEQIKNYSMKWLEKCDAVYLINGRWSGGGVDTELDRAMELELPIAENINVLNAIRHATAEKGGI